MTWLAFVFALEIGFLPCGDFVMYNSDFLDEFYPVKYTAYTELEAEVLAWDILFIGGGIRTSIWQLQESGYGFFPHKAVYNFHAGARQGLLEIGWRHFCIHPVVPCFKYIKPEAIWEGAFDMLYLRISNH
ncbi:hypothetical protein ES703_58751 [subsurface metagenome]